MLYISYNIIITIIIWGFFFLFFVFQLIMYIERINNHEIAISGGVFFPEFVQKKLQPQLSY